MGEHKSNPGAANDGAAPPTLADALTMHARALMDASTKINPATNQANVAINPAQLFCDLALAEVRIELMFTLLVETGILDGKKAGDRLRTMLLHETEQLNSMKRDPSLIQVAHGTVPRNE